VNRTEIAVENRTFSPQKFTLLLFLRLLNSAWDLYVVEQIPDIKRKKEKKRTHCCITRKVHLYTNRRY